MSAAMMVAQWAHHLVLPLADWMAVQMAATKVC